MNDYIIFIRTDGRIKVCGLNEAEHDIELAKGSRYIGTFETELDILNTQKLFKNWSINL